jgi:FkbM family methyltransferase
MTVIRILEVFKKNLNIFINYFGYKIIKNKIYSFDHIYYYFLKNPLIIDVGSNEGQSVHRFLTIFKNPKIHCFEPTLKPYNILKKKYGKKKEIFLNNFALGYKKEKKLINIFQNSSNSSFNKPIKGSLWEKKKFFKSGNLIKNTQIVRIESLDDYIKKKKIKFIDLLKIDTQGFENYVLKGSLNAFKNNTIKFIEVEFIMGNQYANRLNIIDLEKILIKNNFRLYGINQSGDLLSKPYMSFDLLYANSKLIKVK